MAHKFPLQAGDVANYTASKSFAPNEADRRDQEVTIARSNPQRYHGENVAGDQDRPASGRLWKVGQAVPNFSAPFPVIMMDGDNNGYPAEVHEIDLDQYGDGYDATAPLRVRTVAPAENSWNFDSDHDGQRN